MQTYVNASEYMKSISAYRQISPEREIELAGIIHGPDPEAAARAREELVCANLRLVVKIAHSYKKYALPFDDLISEGNLGLMKAADRFEPGHDAKFSVYASWWIKQSMRFAIGTQTNLIRIPVAKGLKCIAVRRLEADYMNEHGEQPPDEWLMREAGLTRDGLADVRRCSLTLVSTEDRVDGQDGDLTYETRLADMEDDGEERREHSGMLSAMESFIMSLPERKRELVCMCYGVCGVKRREPALVSQETGIPYAKVQEEALKAMAPFREACSRDGQPT